MFGIGLPELILIMAIALIVVGPEKLPELAKTVAKQLIELKKAATTLKDSFQEELKETEGLGKDLDIAGELPKDLLAEPNDHQAVEGPFEYVDKKDGGKDPYEDAADSEKNNSR